MKMKTTDVFVVTDGLNFTTTSNTGTFTINTGNALGYSGLSGTSGYATTTNYITNPTYDDFWKFNEEFDILWKSFFEANAVFKPIKEKVTNLACDIQETDNGLLIELAVVGLSKEDIDIIVDSETLRVAYRKEEGKESDYRYLLRSIKKSSFDVAWKISSKYDLAKLEARLDKGLLILDIPFAKENKPKKVTIK